MLPVSESLLMQLTCSPAQVMKIQLGPNRNNARKPDNRVAVKSDGGMAFYVKTDRPATRENLRKPMDNIDC